MLRKVTVTFSKSASQLRSMKDIRKIFLFLTWYIFIPLVSIELIMILADPLIATGFYQYDPELGFRVRAGALRSNSLGFNDREHAQKKPKGVTRIMVLGDSFSWAGGREHNYINQLEPLLKGRFIGRELEVLNVGYPMLGTYEELALFLKHGLPFQPDLLVLAFFVGNDFIESDPFRKRIVVNDTYIDIDRRNETILWGYPIPPQPRFPVFISQKLRVFKEQFYAQRRGQRGEVMLEESYLSLEAHRLRFCRNDSASQTGRETQLALTFDAINQIQSLTRENGVAFTVMIIPDEVQVNELLFEKVIHHADDSAANYNRFCFQDLLTTYLRANNIEYLDLQPLFSQGTLTKSLYKPNDSHWNDDGNALAAKELSDYLSKRLVSLDEAARLSRVLAP
jgi:hypothetical protein